MMTSTINNGKSRVLYSSTEYFNKCKGIYSGGSDSAPGTIVQILTRYCTVSTRPLEERNAEMKLHLPPHRELLSPVLGYFHPVSHSVCLRYIPQRTAPSYTYGRCHSVVPMLEKHIPRSMCISTVSSTVKWRQMEAKMTLLASVR